MQCLAFGPALDLAGSCPVLSCPTLVLSGSSASVVVSDCCLVLVLSGFVLSGPCLGSPAHALTGPCQARVLSVPYIIQSIYCPSPVLSGSCLTLSCPALVSALLRPLACPALLWPACCPGSCPAFVFSGPCFVRPLSSPCLVRPLYRLALDPALDLSGSCPASCCPALVLSGSYAARGLSDCCLARVFPALVRPCLALPLSGPCGFRPLSCLCVFSVSSVYPLCVFCGSSV